MKTNEAERGVTHRLIARERAPTTGSEAYFVDSRFSFSQ